PLTTPALPRPNTLSPARTPTDPNLAQPKNPPKLLQKCHRPDLSFGPVNRLLDHRPHTLHEPSLLSQGGNELLVCVSVPMDHREGLGQSMLKWEWTLGGQT